MLLFPHWSLCLWFHVARVCPICRCQDADGGADMAATPPWKRPRTLTVSPSIPAPQTPPEARKLSRIPPPPPLPASQGVVQTGSLTKEMVAVLDIHSVDKAARRALSLLAESGKAGTIAANEICWKLVKHSIYGHPVRNPSAFVACCVEAAYRQMRA